MYLAVNRFRSPIAVLAAVLSLWSPSAMSEPPATQIRSFQLDAPVAKVFPLFTALGEEAWAEGWKPQLLSGKDERGSVFRTTHGKRETTWIVVDYEPAQARVSYARLARGSNMGLVDVQCTPIAGGRTEVSVRYTLTAVNTQGQAFVTAFLDPVHYSAMIEEWRQAIDRALATGQDKPAREAARQSHE